MFLSSLCLKTVFSKDRGMKSWSPIFFFMYYCPKEAKNTNALREVIMNNNKKKDFWWIKMFSILLQESEGWDRFCKSYSRNHGTVLISDGTPYLTQHAVPKRKDSALFLWQWPMTNGEKISMEHKQYGRGRASMLRSSYLGSSRNTGCGENELRDETKNGSVSDWVGSGMSEKVYRREWFHGSVGNEEVLVSILVEALNFFEAFFIHNRIAMAVGCLEYPGAMSPPHKRKGTGTRHTEKYHWQKNHRKGWEGGGGVAERNLVAWTTQQEGKSPRHWITWGWSELLGMRMQNEDALSC